MSGGEFVQFAPELADPFLGVGAADADGGVGVVIGIVVALASTRALGSLLYGVQAVDATTFVAMSASMIAVGLLASYVPARRASNVDPIESLRGE